MAWASELVHESMSGYLAGSVSRLTRVYMVRTDDDITPIEIRVHAENPVQLRGRPNTGALHPFTPDPELVDYVCTSCDIQFIDSRTYRITGTYESYAVADGGGGGNEFARMSFQSSQRSYREYRSVAAPEFFDADWPPSALTGGTAVDNNGQPLPVIVMQVGIVVEVIYDRAKVARDNGGDAYAPLSTLMVLSGDRNDADWYQFEKGSVLFEGYSIQEINEHYYRVSMHFKHDALGHLEQRVALTKDGKFLPSVTTSTWAGVPVFHASSVYWYQHFPVKSTFPTWPEITTPTPAYPA